MCNCLEEAHAKIHQVGREGKEELKNCTEPGLNHKLTKMTGRVGSSPLTLKGSMAIVPACFAAGFNTLIFAFSSLPEMLLVCP